MVVGRTDPASVAEAWQEIAQTEEGRLILADLAAKFGFQTKSTFDTNAATMAFHEGQRAVMVHIGKLLSLDPQELREKLEGNS